MTVVPTDHQGPPASGDTDVAVPGDERLAVLRTSAGHEFAMDLGRWIDEATPAEYDVLARSLAPVVDLGCGPGRHVVALAERGVPALGVDTSPAALDLARRRGAAVLERSIFDPIPGTGRWGSALLLDGNIGIGGDPARLLRRAAELLHGRGRVLVEVGAPGSGSDRVTARVESRGRRSAWFPWSVVDADDLDRLANRSGWDLSELWTAEDRWFAQLDRRHGADEPLVGPARLAG